MSRIILTQGVAEYRQTIPLCIAKQDVVLEIGCAWGTTSARLFRHAKYVVAVDKGQSLSKAKEKYPHIHFEQIDAFQIRQVQQLGFNFNKVYIDISGCRDIYDIIKLIFMYDNVFYPDLIVVKSTKLKRLMGRCIIWEGHPIISSTIR